MDLGVATLGAGIVGALAVLFSVLISNKTIKVKMEGEHKILEQGNSSLSTEHGELKLEIKEVQKNIGLNQEKLSEKIASVKEIMIEEKTKEEFRYANLTDKQKDIINSVENIKHMAEEIKTQQENISNLQKELAASREENTKLKEEIRKLQRDKRSFEMPDIQR